jgi:hypothetical protein
MHTHLRESRNQVSGSRCDCFQAVKTQFVKVKRCVEGVEYFILGKVNDLCINLNMEGEPTRVHTLLAVTNLSSPLHFPLLGTPFPDLPTVCEDSSSSNFSVCRLQVPEDTNTHNTLYQQMENDIHKVRTPD